MGFAREIVAPEGAPLGVNLLQQGLGSLRGAIGTPGQVRDLLQRYVEAGVDQLIFVSQAGRNRHEHVCESLELFAKEVLPEFAGRADEVDAARRERLAQACERALARRSPAREAPADYVVAPAEEPRAAPALAPAAPSRPGSTAPAGPGARSRAAARVRAGAAAARKRVEERAMAALAVRSDRQVERILLSGPGLRSVMKGMERSFNPAMAEGFSGAIQYELTGEGRSRAFAVRVREGRAVVREGRARAPAVTLRMAAVTFGRILTRQVDTGMAFMQGKIQMEGDVAVALRIGEMFARQP